MKDHGIASDFLAWRDRRRFQKESPRSGLIKSPGGPRREGGGEPWTPISAWRDSGPAACPGGHMQRPARGPTPFCLRWARCPPPANGTVWEGSWAGRGLSPCPRRAVSPSASHRAAGDPGQAVHGCTGRICLCEEEWVAPLLKHTPPSSEHHQGPQYGHGSGGERATSLSHSR